MSVNYYQLITLFEVSEKVLNASGLVINAIFFLFLVVTLGLPSLLSLKHLSLKTLYPSHPHTSQPCKIRKQPKTVHKIAHQLKRQKRLKKAQLRQKEGEKIFTDGLFSRGLIPVYNVGEGNCVFIAVA